MLVVGSLCRCVVERNRMERMAVVLNMQRICIYNLGILMEWGWLKTLNEMQRMGWIFLGLLEVVYAVGKFLIRWQVKLDTHMNITMIYIQLLF